MSALIEIEHLTKRFGRFTAVDDVSFSVARGEVVGFLGPNGAGKSTTMRMLAGFMLPNSGTARICGQDVVQRPVAAKRSLGFLPEGAPTYPEMSVFGFLDFCARIRGFSGAERRALFSPAPGEQHGLGALIVEEFFRRDGWQTWSVPALDETELVGLVAGRAFDVVGLTVSVERHIAPLARSITATRRASRNPAVIVLVGGRVFTARPELARDIGADGTASDGALAVRLADTLLNEKRVSSVLGTTRQARPLA